MSTIRTRAGAGRFGALGDSKSTCALDRSSERGSTLTVSGRPADGFGPPWQLLPRPLASPFASYIIIYIFFN